MPKTVLSKSELTVIVLAAIRRHSGCESVDAVVIQEMTRPVPNWIISIIAASSGDAATVQAAAASVQQELQGQYQIG